MSKNSPPKHGLYELVFSSLSNAFETSKGFGADCPFCFAESTSGKVRFMVFADHAAQEVTGYNCYVCNKKGGSGSLKWLFKELGINVFDHRLLGQEKRRSLFDTPPKPGEPQKTALDLMFKPKSSEVLQLEWPPFWAKRNASLEEAAERYLAKRQIANPKEVIRRFEMVVSSVVDRSGDQNRVVSVAFPSIIVPAVDSQHRIVGWAARRIDGLTEDDGVHNADLQGLYKDTKSISKSGDGWKKTALFGLREVNPDYPVTLVEGVFDALATPNSIALLGKRLSDAQAHAVNDLGAGTYIVAVDPDVASRDRKTLIDTLLLRCPGASVLDLNLDSADDKNIDPSDRGRDEMTRLIRETVLEKK